jgi:hypothetical protein
MQQIQTIVIYSCKRISQFQMTRKKIKIKETSLKIIKM